MSSDDFKTAAATTKEDQAEVETQQLELTDISNLLLFEIAKSLCESVSGLDCRDWPAFVTLPH